MFDVGERIGRFPAHFEQDGVPVVGFLVEKIRMISR